MLQPFKRCFPYYWKFGRSKQLEVHAHLKGGSSWFWRTPLFVIGHYKNAWIYNSTQLMTGWQIDWIPVRWSFKFHKGELLYKKHWDNLVVTTDLIDEYCTTADSTTTRNLEFRDENT